METSESNQLPPLSPSKAQQAPKPKSTLKATVFRSAHPVNSAQLKREMRRIDPRISALDEQVAKLRHDIPPSLTQTMEQLNRDIESVKFNLLPNRSSTESVQSGPELNGIEAKFESLRGGFSKRIETGLSQHIQEIDSLIEEIQSKRAMCGTETSRIFKIDDDQDLLEAKMEAIQKQINKKAGRTKQRMDSISSKLAKLALEPGVAGSSTSNLKQIRQDVDSHRAKITELRTMILKVRNSLDDQKARMKTAADAGLPLTVQSTEALFKLAENSIVPDLTEPLNALRNEIMETKTEFIAEMATLKKQTEENEAEHKEVTTLVHSLDASTNAMEDRIQDIETLCQKLKDQVAVLKEKAEGHVMNERVSALVEEIRRVNGDLESDLKGIQDKLTLCITARPSRKNSPRINQE